MQSFTPSITTAMTSERTTWCVTSDYHTHEHSYTPTTTFFLHWIAMSVSVWYYYTDVISNIYVIPCNNEALQNIMYQWYGQMLPGQMSPWQLQSLLDLQGNLPLKFHQNRVSNSWYILDVNKCLLEKCCLNKCHRDSWPFFNHGPKIRSVRAEMLLIWTNVARTNIAWTNVTVTVG